MKRPKEVSKKQWRKMCRKARHIRKIAGLERGQKFNFNSIRPKGEPMRRGGSASGPIPYLMAAESMSGSIVTSRANRSRHVHADVIEIEDVGNAT